MANLPIGQKDRPWTGRITFRNGEASTNISQGVPVALAMSGTLDGVNVVLPSTATAAKAHSLFMGIAVPTKTDPNTPNGVAPPGAFFDVIVGGFAPIATVFRASRAASTDAWPSFPAISVGDQLAVDTVQNMLVRVGTVGSSQSPVAAVALDTFASATTAASDAYTALTAASATRLSSNSRAFVRLLG